MPNHKIILEFNRIRAKVFANYLVASNDDLEHWKNQLSFYDSTFNDLLKTKTHPKVHSKLRLYQSRVDCLYDLINIGEEQIKFNSSSIPNHTKFDSIEKTAKKTIENILSAYSLLDYKVETKWKI